MDDYLENKTVREIFVDFRNSYLPGGQTPYYKTCPRWLAFLPVAALALGWVCAFLINNWGPMSFSYFGSMFILFAHLGIGVFYGLFGGIKILSKKASYKYLIKSTVCWAVLMFSLGVLSIFLDSFGSEATSHFVDYIFFGLIPTIPCVVLGFLDLVKWRNPMIGAIVWGLMALSFFASLDLASNNMVKENEPAIYVITSIALFLLLLCAEIKARKHTKIIGAAPYIFVILSAIIAFLSSNSYFALIPYGIVELGAIVLFVTKIKTIIKKKNHEYD